MLKKDNPTSYGYLRYPYNAEIKAIFLKESRSGYYDIYHNNIKIASQQVSKNLRTILQKKGYEFVRSEKIHLTGAKSVFGVRFNIVKHIKKNKIIELEIVVPGKSTSDTERKVAIISTQVESLTGISCSVDGSKKWERC